jgi:hypothetical protein
MSVLIGWLAFLLILFLIAALLWAAVTYLPLPAPVPAFVKPMLYVVILVGCAIAVAYHAGLVHG